MKQIRKRITYANVMSSLAVFLVLGGATAFAASKIGSNQLKKNAVTSAKIKRNAITTAKIKNDAVTGAKVKESTLGTVPSATNASTVNGRTVTQIFAKIPVNSTVTLGTFGPFKFTATCDAAGNVEDLTIDPQTTDTDLAAFGTGNKGPIFSRNNGTESNSISLDADGTNDNDRGIASFSAAQTGGLVISGTLAFDDAASFNAENVCAVYGHVTS